MPVLQSPLLTIVYKNKTPEKNKNKIIIYYRTETRTGYNYKKTTRTKHGQDKNKTNNTVLIIQSRKELTRIKTKWIIMLLTG